MFFELLIPNLTLLSLTESDDDHLFSHAAILWDIKSADDAAFLKRIHKKTKRHMCWALKPALQFHESSYITSAAKHIWFTTFSISILFLFIKSMFHEYFGIFVPKLLACILHILMLEFLMSSKTVTTSLRQLHSQQQSQDAINLKCISISELGGMCFRIFKNMIVGSQ